MLSTILLSVSTALAVFTLTAVAFGVPMAAAVCSVVFVGSLFLHDDSDEDEDETDVMEE